jgi:hypothetical protein
MLTLRETRIENHTPLRSRLVGWYLMLPPLTSPVHHYAWAHRSHDFAAASFFGSAKSRGTDGQACVPATSECSPLLAGI